MKGETVAGDTRISSNNQATAAAPAHASGVRSAGAWLLNEFYEILPPTIFFLSAST